MKYRKKLLFAVILIFFVVVPSFIWIVLNEQPYGGDQSEHARDTVILFYTLIQSPTSWPSQMLHVIITRGPGIAWIGQFFVPLGFLIGSVDKALLLSLTFIQMISLWLIYGAVLQLGQGKIGLASLGVLVVGAAPLFVGLGHLYLTETFQILAVAWFVLILALAPVWNRAFLLGQLLAAASFALLMRATTPIYVFVVGLVALGYVVWPARPWGWSQKKSWLVWSVATVLVIATILWYKQNLNWVIEHSRVATSGPIAALWGKEDTFLNNFLYWLEEIQHNFFLPVVLGLSGVLIISGVVTIRYKSLTTKPELRHFTLCAIAALLQIIAVLSLFSLNTNRVARYLLPILPSLTLLICWGAAQFYKKPLIIGLLLALYLSQFMLVQGQVLSLLTPNPLITGHLWTLTTDPTDANIMDEIIARTCTPDLGSGRYANILAVDPELKGDWLAPVPANYAVVKYFGRELPCEYVYAGNSFFGAGLTETWQDLQLLRPHFFITSDPQVYPPRPNSINQSLTSENHPALLEKIKDSGLFVQESSLQADPGILIFHWIDYISLGRQLSDSGQHKQAINALRKATELEPTNVEAWANLALTYSRNNQIENAIAAARQALNLNPDHYWVNYHLALALYNYGQWAEVITLAQRALINAPESEKAGVLTLLGRTYTQTDAKAEACRYFLQANTLQPNQEISAEMKILACPDPP